MWIAALIALTALLLRFLFTFQLKGTPLFDSPGLDAAYYLDRARQIAAGDWLGDQVLFMGPLYPYWLAIVGKLSGFSMTTLRLAQGLLGAGSTLLLFMIGRKLLDLRIASLAAVGMACSVIAIYYDNLFLMTSLVAFLNLLVLWDLTRLKGEPGPVRLIASGALLGVAALARASVLLFAPAALLWLWMAPHRSTRRATDRASTRASAQTPARNGSDAPARTPAPQSRQRRLLLLAAYAAGLTLVIGLTATRNAVVGRDLVLMTSNGGLNLFIGNNPLGRGTYMPLDRVARAAGAPGHVDISWMIEDPTGRAVAEAAAGRSLKPSAVSRFFARRTFDYVRQQPGRAARILGRKLLLFFNATEIAQIEDPLLYRQLIPLMRWPLLTFGVVGPLALLGIALSFRQWRRFQLLHLYVLTYTLSIILFFVTSRYRAPIMPILLLFAAHALFWCCDTLRSLWREAEKLKRLARLGVAGAGLVAATWIVHLDLVQIDRAAAFINLGIAYAQDERFPEAIDAFQRAVESEPLDVTARYNLAAAHLRAGQLAEAKASFGNVLALEPRSVSALVGLARTEMQMGDPAAAAGTLRQAATAAPGRAELWLELANVEAASQQPDSALAALNRVVALDPGAAPAWNALTSLHLEAGRYDAALETATQAAARQPGNPQIHSHLGMLQAMHGRPDLAETAMRRALEIHPGFLPARLGLARLFMNGGLGDSARVHLRIAEEQAPGNEQVEALRAELARR